MYQINNFKEMNRLEKIAITKHAKERMRERGIKVDDIFHLLKGIDTFINTCTVLNDTLAWDIHGTRDNTTCLDIDPDTLYELPFVSEKIA